MARIGHTLGSSVEGLNCGGTRPRASELHAGCVPVKPANNHHATANDQTPTTASGLGCWKLGMAHPSARPARPAASFPSCRATPRVFISHAVQHQAFPPRHASDEWMRDCCDSSRGTRTEGKDLTSGLHRSWADAQRDGRNEGPHPLQCAPPPHSATQHTQQHTISLPHSTSRCSQARSGGRRIPRHAVAGPMIRLSRLIPPSSSPTDRISAGYSS
jgi:hypothetical protein